MKIRCSRRGNASTLASLCAALCVAAIMIAPAASFGHGARAPLEDWGNFGTTTASCQKAIGRAAALCTRRAIHNRNVCLAAEIDDKVCNHQALEDSSIATRARALALVERYCESSDLQNLNYLDLSDVLIDVAQTCREADIAATSAVWGPAMVDGAVAAARDDEQACIRSSARAASRLLRFAIRVQQRALNRIAGENLTSRQKTFEVERAQSFIARIRDRAQRRLSIECPDAEFQALYGRDINTLLESVQQRAECVSDFVYIVDGATNCPEPVCGNSVLENGEECDDGNDFEGDACLSDCKKAECDSFANTYDLIQKAIFENRGCTAELCHSSENPGGGLDLTAGNSYASLIDVPSTTAPGFKRVDPGNRANSLLWVNVAAKVIPGEVTAPLRAMPLGPDSLTSNEVEALRQWIESGGATRTETVPGTGELLDACLPEPEPIHIEPLAPPPAGEGIQLHMPVWELEPTSESEVCYTSYYDLTGLIPDELLNEDGTAFHYNKVEIRQDPLSHHLIIDFFRGDAAPNDPIWGPYSCSAGPRDGEPCDPTEINFCGSGDCATEPDHNAIACIGFGPQQGLSTLTSGGFAFAQETTALFKFPTNVFDEVPIKGNVLWNSHAFNLTRKRGKLEAWINIYFPKPEEQVFQQEQIFNANKIFWDVPFIGFPPREILPFEELEVCHIHTFGRPPEQYVDSPLGANQTGHLFELSGHMHEHGKRFQIYRGMFTCAGGPNVDQPCSPRQPEMCPSSLCREVGGRAADDALMYTNLIYNDPVVLRFDEPLSLPGSSPVEDRSLTYCAHFENGVAPNFDQVKRRSTSPPGGSFGPFTIGGPCSVNKTRCIGGPNHNQLCNGDNAQCESAPGAGDGDGDACPLTGGFRTQDEMFIIFGNYWVSDN